MDSGDDSLDDSGSNTGPETSSATTPTCAVSPDVSSLDESKMKNTITDGKDAEGPVIIALNLQNHQNSSWLDIDLLPDNHPEFEDKSGSNGAKDGGAKDGSQEMDPYVNEPEDRPGDEDIVVYSGEDIIADPETDGIEVDGDGFHSKGDHRAGAGGDAQG